MDTHHTEPFAIIYAAMNAGHNFVRNNNQNSNSDNNNTNNDPKKA